MAIVVSDKIIENVYVNNVQMEKVYVNNELVYDLNNNVSYNGYFCNEALCGNDAILSLIE
jgi:hypothetical protein